MADIVLLNTPWSRSLPDGTSIKTFAFHKTNVSSSTQIVFKVPVTGRIEAILLCKIAGTAANFAPEIKAGIVIAANPTADTPAANIRDAFPTLAAATYDFGAIYAASSAAAPRNLEVDRVYIAPDGFLRFEPNPDAGTDNEVFGYISIRV